MNTLPEIPEDILMRAGRFLDLHAGVRDPRHLVALAFMQAEQPRQCRLGLTPQQSKCLRAIRAHQSAHQVSPTVRDLMAELGLASTSGVIRLLKGLEARGCIKRMQGRARAITMLERV